MEEKKKKERHPVTLVILIIALAVMIFCNRKTGWHSEGLQGIRKDIPDTGIRICGASGWRRGTLAGRNPHSV